MFDLFEPTKRGQIDRVSFLDVPPQEIACCFNGQLGHFLNLGPEWEKHTWIEGDPDLTNAQQGNWHAALVAVWPTDDRGNVEREFVGYVEFKAWLMSKWTWQDVQRRFTDWPLDKHDLQIACIEPHPVPRFDVSPCRERILNKLSKSDDQSVRGELSKHIRAAQHAAESVWRGFDAKALVPALTLEQVETRMALHAAQQGYQAHIRKWEHNKTVTLQPGMWFSDGHDRFTITKVGNDRVTVESPHLATETLTEAEARRRGPWEYPPLSDDDLDAILDGLEPEPEPAKERIDQLIVDLRADPGRARALRLALAAGDP